MNQSNESKVSQNWQRDLRNDRTSREYFWTKDVLRSHIKQTKYPRKMVEYLDDWKIIKYLTNWLKHNNQYMNALCVPWLV